MNNDRLRAALKRVNRKLAAEEWVYGLVGKITASGPVYDVPGRAGFIYVRLRNANGAQSTPPARNDPGVPQSAGLPVRMYYEGTVLVIDSVNRRPDLATVDPPPASGVHIHKHDDRYFQKTEHIDVSAGVADAGKPVVLDAGGLLSNTFLDVELSSIAGLTSAADRLPYYTGLGAASLATFTAFARSFLDDADAATVRATLGLGTIATEAETNFLRLLGRAGSQVASGGTASGESLTLHGSAHATKGPVLVQPTSGNTGFGTADVEAWESSFSAMQLGGASALMFSRATEDTYLVSNAYYDGAWKRRISGLATQWNSANGVQLLAHGVSGAADSAISWVTDLRIAGDGGITLPALVAKVTPVDADEFIAADSAASSILKKITWANIKATLKTYLDTLYVALTGDQTIAGVKTFSDQVILSATSFKPLIIERISANSSAQAMAFRKSRGGTGVVIGDQLLRHMAFGELDTGVYAAASTAQDVMTAEAMETFTATAQGRRLRFFVVTVGTTTPLAALTISDSGVVGIPGILFVTGDTGIGISPLVKLHILQATLGGVVQRLQSTATSDDPIQDTLQGRIATTDATVTTLQTIAIPASNTCMLEVAVIARRTGGAAGTAEDGAGYILRGVFKNVAGTATIIGAIVQTVVGESVAGYDATLDVTGSDARVRVTGVASTNISWHAHTRHWYLST